MLYLALTLIILIFLLLTLTIHPNLLTPHLTHLHTTIHPCLPTILTQHLHLQPPTPYSPLRRPSLGTAETKIHQQITPYQFPPLRPKSTSRMAMGLKRLDASNWLTLDSNYLPEHSLRLSLLATRHEDTIAVLPFPGVAEACHEVLALVTSFLATRFPQHFTIRKSWMGMGIAEERIENHLTGEVYTIGDKCVNPLEIAAKLAMEDFNILVKNEEGEYCLMGSATLFPAGWKLRERIGYSMARLHGPVPGWSEKLGGSVNRYFDHLSPKTSMERTNLFIQTTPHLFQDEPESLPSPSPSPVSCPSNTFTTSSHPAPPQLTPKSLLIRRERQTFTRLPISNAVLFTVRTYMTPLEDLDDEQVRALRSQVFGWEEEVREYKGWGIWGDVLMGWCERRVGKVEVEFEDRELEMEEKREGGGGGCMWLQ